MARQRLPKTEIDIVTNGDYLNPRALTRFQEAGLSVLRISVYMRHGVAWSVAAAQDEIKRLGKRIQSTPVWDVSTATTVGAAFPYKRMEIVAFSHNCDEVGYDRGQLIEELVDREYVRTSPCVLVFSNFTVDFNGKVMPCCNLRSDTPQHEQFVLADPSKRQQSIFDVYANRQFTEWRRDLVTAGEKQQPCTTCKQKMVAGPALMEMGKAVESRLHEIGVQV